jgi:hypothetical protein
MTPRSQVPVFLWLSNPFPKQAQSFRKANSTGPNPPLPYTMMAFNGFLWSVYALLLGDFFPMMVSNALQFILGVHYAYLFERHNSRQVMQDPFPLNAAAAAGMCGLGFVALVYEHTAALQLVGQVGVVAVVAMFASPLVAMARVIRTRNSSALSPRFRCLPPLHPFFNFAHFPPCLRRSTASPQTIYRWDFSQRTRSDVFGELACVRASFARCVRVGAQ